MKLNWIRKIHWGRRIWSELLPVQSPCKLCKNVEWEKSPFIRKNKMYNYINKVQNEKSYAKGCRQSDALRRVELPVLDKEWKEKKHCSEVIVKEPGCPQTTIVIQAARRPSSAMRWRLACLLGVHSNPRTVHGAPRGWSHLSRVLPHPTLMDLVKTGRQRLGKTFE